MEDGSYLNYCAYLPIADTVFRILYNLIIMRILRDTGQCWERVVSIFGGVQIEHVGSNLKLTISFDIFCWELMWGTMN
jgi:hypothetical protein